MSSLDLNEKIADDKPELVSSKISLNFFKVDKNLDLENIKEFVEKNSIQQGGDINKGFSKKIVEKDGNLILNYLKKGVRTLKFLEGSKVINKPIQLVTHITELRFITNKNRIVAIGGSRQFLEKDVFPMLKKLTSKYNIKIRKQMISTRAIDKLCLKIHREHVNTICFDPSNSKDYAEEVSQSEGEKEYAHIISENKSKGKKILDSKALKRLFKSNPEIEITEFKSKINTKIDGEAIRVRYEVLKKGKITFYGLNRISALDRDEFKIGEKLFRALKARVEEQGLLIEYYEDSKDKSHKPLNLFSSDEAEKIVNNIKKHYYKDDKELSKSQLKKLQNQHLKKTSQEDLLNFFLQTLKEDPSFSIEIITLVEDAILEEKFMSMKNEIQEILAKLDKVSLQGIYSKSTTMEKLILDMIYEKKQDLKKLWQQCNTEKNANKKGRLFEIFCEEMFNMHPQLNVVKRNYISNEEEFDLVIENNANEGTLAKFDSYIIVECKNISDKVKVESINHFITKLSNRSNTNPGIIITTGEFPRSIERKKQSLDGKRLVTINGKRLDSFLNNKESIENLISECILEST